MLQLTEKGYQNLQRFLEGALNQKSLPLTDSMLRAWERAISDNGDEMHLEVRGFNSVTGNPITTTFRGDEVTSN